VFVHDKPEDRIAEELEPFVGSSRPGAGNAAVRAV
jgi:hypothetical protein